jgi:hypothetical protein
MSLQGSPTMSHGVQCSMLLTPGRQPAPGGTPPCHLLRLLNTLNPKPYSLWVVGPCPGARLPPIAARAQVQQAGVAVGLHGDAPRHAAIVLRQRPQRVPVTRRVSYRERNLHGARNLLACLPVSHECSP